ncbi:MAG: hydroxymethylbilane synthase [Archaeoglobus sp.]|nr:hydroxymethylbilane synthase [Archaeoglobus sp.]
MPERVVVGTRGSKLALAQAEKVIYQLKKAGKEVKIQIIKTSGDIMKDKPLYAFKRSGAFVRAIDQALADEEIDVAVHSMKDVPTDRVEGTVIAAVLERESPFDAFISRNGKWIEEMDSGAVIGTSSLRRIAQARRLRDDVSIKDIRGNLDTRLRKLESGDYDGIIVGEAGLIRLGLHERISYERLNPELFVPSANQGIIAVATREGEEELVSFMNHRKTMFEAMVEREILKELGVGCSIPAGIYSKLNSKLDGNSFEIKCELLSLDGRKEARFDRKFEVELEKSEGYGECSERDLKVIGKEVERISEDIKAKVSPLLEELRIFDGG